MATIGDLNWNANKAISDDDKEDEDERDKDDTSDDDRRNIREDELLYVYGKLDRMNFFVLVIVLIRMNLLIIG